MKLIDPIIIVCSVNPRPSVTFTSVAVRRSKLEFGSYNTSSMTPRYSMHECQRRLLHQLSMQPIRHFAFTVRSCRLTSDWRFQILLRSIGNIGFRNSSGSVGGGTGAVVGGWLPRHRCHLKDPWYGHRAEQQSGRDAPLPARLTHARTADRSQ